MGKSKYHNKQFPIIWRVICITNRHYGIISIILGGNQVSELRLHLYTGSVEDGQ